MEEVAEAASEEAALAAAVAEAAASVEAALAEAMAAEVITIIIDRFLEVGSIDHIITEADALVASSVCLCCR